MFFTPYGVSNWIDITSARLQTLLVGKSDTVHDSEKITTQDTCLTHCDEMSAMYGMQK